MFATVQQTKPEKLNVLPFLFIYLILISMWSDALQFWSACVLVSDGLCNPRHATGGFSVLRCRLLISIHAIQSQSLLVLPADAAGDVISTFVARQQTKHECIECIHNDCWRLDHTSLIHSPLCILCQLMFILLQFNLRCSYTVSALGIQFHKT